MPFLRNRFAWTEEEALWFAFLNGNTQHPVTSLLLHQHGSTPAESRRMLEFFEENYDRLEFDTDRRYHKKDLAAAVDSYGRLLDGRSQRAMWSSVVKSGGFRLAWNAATTIRTFGRLSAFSYLEYLRIMGVEVECDTLFLEDKSGSRSHRNGLCIVSGRERFDWHASNPTFDGNYPKWLLWTLAGEARELLEAARERAVGKPWERDVGYFTLESTLCTYKSWHRPNRRYPNVYNDMLYDRLVKSAKRWPEAGLSVFWEARAAILPEHLLLEKSWFDPGLSPAKQNHYLDTGQVIMMDVEYPQYANDFNDAVRRGAWGLRSE
jgi:hypothetical protein